MKILLPRNIIEALTLIFALYLFFKGWENGATSIVIVSYIFWIWRSRFERGYLIFKPVEPVVYRVKPDHQRHIQNYVTDVVEDYGLVGVFLDKEVIGPTVTRHFIRIPTGIVIKKMPDKDMARDMGAESISIDTNAGKSLLSIDVPNKIRATVKLNQLLQNPLWQEKQKTMTLPCMPAVLATGEGFIFDIAKTPQMIVAGTTGSGKSVFVNAMLLSLMSTHKPFKLIISDGKGEDFFPYYSQSKHLVREGIQGVAREIEDMVEQVEWLESEMDKRFSGQSSKAIPILYVSDEHADISLQDKDKSIERRLTRVAQKGRSANMHCIICTQTPNADVLPKTLRANIPSRVALTVGRGKESEIIMDEWGAEKLLGLGDAIIKLVGKKSTRIQGAMVTDANLKTLIK